jgi:hypothetical protein
VHLFDVPEREMDVVAGCTWRSQVAAMTVEFHQKLSSGCARGKAAVSYADLAEQLFREFEPAHSLAVISAVVRRCRADLSGSPGEERLELLEDMARQQLTALPSIALALRQKTPGGPSRQPLGWAGREHLVRQRSGLRRS